MSTKSECAPAMLKRLLLLTVVCLALSAPARAHNGPPFPIVEDKRVGPVTISLWTHPDLGTGTFFVIVNPVAGGTIPADLKVRIAVQPESGRLKEAVYDTWRDAVRDHVQFDNNQVAFDRQEFWRVRLILESSAGGAEVISRVEPTPAGFGKWDLLFYALPFGLVLAMWFRGISRHRKRSRSGIGPVVPENP
jgi:hypothetical protein